MAYELAWEPHGIYKRLWGFVPADEFVESEEAVIGHERFHEVRYVINDFSEMTAHGVTDACLAALEAQQSRAHAINPRCRIFFVTRDGMLAGLIDKHLVDAPMLGYEVVVTETLAQARLWLETQPATFRLNRKYGYREFLAR